MRWNATRRPPASQTEVLTLMLSSFALAIEPAMMRLASSRVRAILCLPLNFGQASVASRGTIAGACQPRLAERPGNTQSNYLFGRQPEHWAQHGIGVGAQTGGRPA